jgi:hypothetical protein
VKPPRSLNAGLVCAALVTALASTPAAAGVIVVDPSGGGNFDNIPEAMSRGSEGDTVLVLPGYYEVEIGIPYPWPVQLTSDSPALASRDGAASTLILGDGSIPAFEVSDGTSGARVFISGFKFMQLTTPFTFGYPTNGTVEFVHNVIEDCETGVDLRFAAGCAAHNVIEGPGYYGISAAYFEGTIEDNKISGFTDTGIISTNENTTLIDNHIHDNGISGVTASADCIAEGNLVENNGWYGFSIPFEAHLTDNTIRGNGIGVDFWTGPNTGVMHGNRIYDNAERAIHAYAGDTDPPTYFDATENWWGTTDAGEIAEAIWDCNDSDWAGVCFTVEPWCMTPDCDPTGVAQHVSWTAVKALYR